MLKCYELGSAPVSESTEEDAEKGHYNDNHLIEEDRARDIAKRLREKIREKVYLRACDFGRLIA